jgi:hypothetical protein
MSCGNRTEVPKSILESRLVSTNCTPVPPNVISVHANAAYAYEEKQSSIGPMASRIALGSFLRLVDPDADNLPRSAHGNVQRDGQADGSCRVQVG